MKNREELGSLIPDGGTGLELGVAAGNYMVALLKRYPRITMWGVDRYSDHHDDAEYKLACSRLSEFPMRAFLLRDTFERATAKLQDAYFDFIYVDGYAHTGQEGGKTLSDWWPKLKPGGIFAGHDFHAQWPLTKDAVRAFSLSVSVPFYLTGETAEGEFPSWWMTKPTSAGVKTRGVPGI